METNLFISVRGLEIDKYLNNHTSALVRVRLCVSVANEGRAMFMKQELERRSGIEECLGVKPHPERKNLRDFEDFCSLWTKDDLDEFEKKTSDLREIDDADWQ